MNKKNLRFQIVNPANRITIQDLAAESVGLSEKDLQQVIGGNQLIITISTKPRSPWWSPGPFPNFPGLP